MLSRDIVYGDELLPQLEAALRAVTREAADTLGMPQSIPSRSWIPVREVGPNSANLVGVTQAQKWTTRQEETRPDYLSSTFLYSQASQLFSSARYRPLFDDLFRIVEKDRRLVCRSALSWRTGDPSQKGRPAIFLHSFVVPFLIEYFALARLGGFDDEAFDRAFGGIEMDLPTPLYAIRLVTPLANVWLRDETLEVAPGVRLKRVLPREIERWLNMKTNAKLSLGYVPEEELLTVQCALEVTAEGTAHEKLESPLGITVSEQAIAVLRLLLPSRVFPILTEYQVLGLYWTPVGYRPHWAPGYRFDMPAGLDCEGGRRMARLFSGIRVGRNRHAAKLALRRWSSAWDRARPEDALIDYWVAFESLFVPERSTSIKWLASARVAAFLEEDEDSLRRAFDDMMRSYSFRSGIVHAERELETLFPDTIEQSAETTAAYLRRSLISILETTNLFCPQGLEATVAAFPWASVQPQAMRTQSEYVRRIRRFREEARIGLRDDGPNGASFGNDAVARLDGY